jgi:hypothetical protein
VPEVYDSLHFPRLEKNLPAFFVKNRPLGMPAWRLFYLRRLRWR